MFEREHHQRIAAILRCVDGQKLLGHHCLLGGGTAIVLARGEYREVLHIELNCHSAPAYRSIRRTVDARDAGWLFRVPVRILREPSFDRHGIRFAAALGGTPVKVEIILESRLLLKPPMPEDRVEGVWTMARQDLVATKLMANADRHADDAFMSRDIIDLAMTTADGLLLPEAVAKARSVYGMRINTAFGRAKEMLLESDARLLGCMHELKMKMPPQELRQRIERLAFLDSAR